MFALLAFMVVALPPRVLCIQMLFGSDSCCVAKPEKPVKAKCPCCATKECKDENQAPAPTAGSCTCCLTADKDPYVPSSGVYVSPVVVELALIPDSPVFDLQDALGSTAHSLVLSCAPAPPRVNCVLRI